MLPVHLLFYSFWYCPYIHYVASCSFPQTFGSQWLKDYEYLPFTGGDLPKYTSYKWRYEGKFLILLLGRPLFIFYILYDDKNVNNDLSYDQDEEIISEKMVLHLLIYLSEWERFYHP